MGISTLEIDYHVVEHRSLIETLPMTATHNSAPIRGLSSNGTEMYAKGVDRYLPEMRLRRIQE